MNANVEKWKPVAGFELAYEVSNFGRVRRTRNGQLKALRKHSHGYLQTNIGSVPKRVHRLVADAFCEKRDGATEVNHINGRKDDNRAENLEWTTRAGNMAHAWSTGLAHKCPVLTEEQLSAIPLLRSKFTARQVGKMFGVCSKTIVRAYRLPNWREFQAPKRAA